MLTIITPDQSRSARRELGISQADVASALQLNRQYLSEFENGHTSRLTSNQLRKLRSFFEEKIQEAISNGEEIEITFGAVPDQESQEPIVTLGNAEHRDGLSRALLAVRHLSIDPSLSNDQVKSILDKIALNDAQAEKVFQIKAKADLLGEWNALTDAALRDIFGLFAANYALLRHLQGRSLVVMPSSNGQIESISDLFAHLFHEENADVIEAGQPEMSNDQEATE